MAGIIFQVEVVVLIALNTVCVVMTIKAIGNVASKTLFSDEEVINGVITVGACGPIGIVVIGFIAIQAMR